MIKHTNQALINLKMQRLRGKSFAKWYERETGKVTSYDIDTNKLRIHAETAIYKVDFSDRTIDHLARESYECLLDSMTRPKYNN